MKMNKYIIKKNVLKGNNNLILKILISNIFENFRIKIIKFL